MNLNKSLQTLFGRPGRKPFRSILGDGLGNVAVPGRPGYVWAQVDGAVFQCWNDTAPVVDTCPVWVGYDPRTPNLLQVLEVDRSAFTGETAYNATRTHADTHEWMKGYDVLPVWGRQIMDCRVSISTGFVIEVNPGIANGQYVETASLDLSSEVPTTPGMALYVLIYVGSDAAVYFRSGTEVDAWQLSPAQIPATQNLEYALAAVRLYEGQTELVETPTDTDIIELRFFQLGVAGPSGDGTTGYLTKWTSPTVLGSSGIFDNITAGKVLTLTATLDASLTVTGAAGVSGSNTGDQVVPANEAGAANNFLTAYNSATGAWTKAQPTWANIDKSTSSIADIATRSHTVLTDIGTNTHALIDTALARLANTSGTNTGDQTLSGLGGVPTTRTISTTAPLTGGGDMSADRTLAISAATGAAAGSMSAADKTKLDAITGTNTGDQVVPANEAGAANNFLTAYNNTTGAWTKARPTWANIDKTTSDIADIATRSHASLTSIGTNTHAQIDTALTRLANTSGTNTGDQVVPANTTATAGQFFTAYNSTTGAFTKATPDHTALSNIGTNTHAQIDTALTRLANTSGTNTGDQVVPANEAGASNNFLTAYNSTTGAWTKARPTWANIDKSTSSIADIATRSHTSLTDIGTNTHAQIDTALTRLANTSGTNTGDQTPGLSMIGNGSAQYQIPVTGATPFTPVWTTATGTGSPVLATSPTLVTPDIGVATATRVGIGITPTVGLHVSGQAIILTTGTDQTANLTGTTINTTKTSAANDARTNTNFSTTMTLAGAFDYSGVNSAMSASIYHGGTGLLSDAVGMYFIGGSTSTGRITSLDIVRARPFGAGSGQIDTLTGFRVFDLAATGTPIAMYGMRIDASSTATTTGSSKYGIVINSLANGAVNNIGLTLGTFSGGSGNNAAIHLTGTGGTTTSGLLFGTDTTLYRSAADQLKTDDSLYVALRAGIGAAPVAYVGLNLLHDITDSATDTKTLSSVSTATFNSGTPRNVYGSYFWQKVAGGGVASNAVQLVSTARNYYAMTTQHTVGLIAQSIAGAFAAGNTSTGRVIEQFGVRINGGANSGGGTVDLNYGLVIDAQTGGSTNYSIITNDGNAVFNEGGAATTDFRIESNTETNMFFLDADDGASGEYIYLGGTTNGIRISKGGELALLGTATVFKDIWVDGTNLHGGATDPPVFAVFQNGVYANRFDDAAIMSAQGSIELQHDHKDGSNFEFHIHWSPSTTNTGNCRWGIEYTMANMNTGTFGATTTVYGTTGHAGSGTVNKHQYTSIATITGTGLTAGAVIMFRLFREGTHALDTFTGNAFLLRYGIHYEVDKLGSAT